MIRLLPVLAACSEYDLNAQRVEPRAPEEENEWAPGRDETGTPDPTCDDFRAPKPYAVSQDDTCLRAPTVGSFTPVVEWQWNSNPVYSGYHQIMSTPAIANLTDDNGDGLVNEDDIPDIVFTSFAGGAYTSAGTLTAISGNGSGTLWSTTGNGIYSSAGVAIGDLDADGRMEVCTGATSYSVACFDGETGALKWEAGPEPGYVAAPAIADMDGDGLGEVIAGRHVMDAYGNPVLRGGRGLGYAQFSFAVDWDLDGELELITGDAVTKLDGTEVLYTGQPDGIPAVGDFNLDGRPDLVTTYGGTIRLVMNDGTLQWAVPVYGGGSGGPPTVADFDADGYPEVGVAGASYYSVTETDGSVRWAMPVSDYSSNVTGSSVFDFEGDGAAEVVYADEHTLWVYDGATGAVELQHDGHASGTLYEYPLIADVDHDGSTEIIVASNNYAFGGWNGITVIGDASASWAPARPVWNEFAYHITNINNDGTIPSAETPNWLSWNNFRAGGTELGPSNWLADLRPGEPKICDLVCADGTVDVYLPIENPGLIPGSAVLVRLYRSDGSAGGEWTLDLPAGEASILGPLTLRKAEWGDGVARVAVDPDRAIEECHEEDNVVELGAWPCD